MSTKNTPIKTATNYFKAQKLRIVFASLWVVFVYQIIMSGFELNPYELQMLDANVPHSYDRDLVVILVVAMLFHLSFLITIDVYMRSQWKFFAMLIITTLFLLCFGMVAMHAPPSLVCMIFWTFLSFLLFLVICFCHACSFFLRCAFCTT